MGEGRRLGGIVCLVIGIVLMAVGVGLFFYTVRSFFITVYPYQTYGVVVGIAGLAVLVIGVVLLATMGGKTPSLSASPVLMGQPVVYASLQSPASPQNPMMQAATVERKVFCPKCGNQYSAEIGKFCPKDATALQSVL